MKKETILFLAMSATLYPSVADVENLYKQNNYEQAIKEAKNSTSEYGDTKLHLLWAKSAQALGKVEEAIAAYERVLMISPDHYEARIELAKLYANSDRMALTKQLAEDTDDYQLTTEERTTITALVVEDNKLLDISANVAVGYDSNINVSPGDLDLPTGGEEIGSAFVRLGAALSYTHYFEAWENLYLRGNAAFSYQSNEESYYNLLIGLANVGLGYKSDAYEIFVPLEYSRIHYLESDLMESVGVKPKMNIVLSDSLVGNINARVEKRSYLQDVDKKRDDTVLGVGAGLYWLFGDNVAYVKANYNDYSAKYEDPLPFVEKSSISFSTGVNYQIDDKYTASAAYLYRYTDYEDPIAFNDDARSDDYHKADLKLSRSILEKMEGTLAYSYMTNSSNYVFSQYDKHIIMCNLNFKY